ncbi:RPA-related protein RADX isoform 1-T1 [Synchiropus picturatus]
MARSLMGCRDSFLQRTLNRLSSKQCLTLSKEESVPVAVIAIQRYLSDQKDVGDSSTYSYDVTVTDGVWKRKCFLHPSLNHLVSTNTLKTGENISITQCSFLYNERRLGHGYIRIEEVRCGSGGSALLDGISDVSQLPMLAKDTMERSEDLRSDLPLQLTRKHYLPLWNNEDTAGDIWTSECPSSDRALDVSKIDFLSDLGTDRKLLLPLLVRVIHKSRLHYYGKHGHEINFPYQAYFEVADRSGTMSLVLWNDLCPQFYQRICIGTVLHLQNYVVKKSYHKRTRPQMDQSRFKSFQLVEIGLNVRNPASVITVVSPKSVQPQWGLPEVSYQFIPRSQVENLANNSACDVIGLVMFVGRVERVKSRPSTAGAEKFWTYRWVHAVDETSVHPFILELFSSSQAEIFTTISPMSYIVCTQMRVRSVEGSLPYLTSSSETQIFITGHHKGQPYVNDNRVRTFIQWTKTLKDNMVLEKTAVGGHYCYPHLPRTYSRAKQEATTPMVAASDLKTELESLSYRERKKLAIQGQITAVRYMRSFPAPQEPDAEQVQPDAAKNGLQTGGYRSQTTLGSPVQRKRRRRARNFTVPLSSSSSSSEHDEDREQQAAAESHCAEHCWESSKWPQQRLDVAEHVSLGCLHQQSLSRRFSLEEKDAQLQWLNLQPGRWSPERSRDTVTEVDCPGYYLLTIIGINRQISINAAFYPVTSCGDPRAVGLPTDPHDNTLLSCLTSGYIYPLGVTAEHPSPGNSDTPPQLASATTHVHDCLPEELIRTASELEDTHLVCTLDLCHLGGQEVEVVVSKIYKMADVSDK